MKRALSLILAIVFITTFASVGYAQNAPVKLGRGIINTLTGFLEVPLKVIRVSKNEGMPMGLSVGVLKGIGWGLYRTVVGVYEVITFPIPAPAGYEPIMDPPHLFTNDTMAGDPSMAIEFRLLEEEISGKSGGSKRSVK